jgi:gliding motility-associated-like protein
MKKLLLPLLLCSMLTGLLSCGDKEGEPVLCNCSGTFYRFRAGGSTLIYPTAFTPNSDGVNDRFRAVHASMLPDGYNLTVYNGAKEVIYTTNDIYSGWDGYMNGSPAPAGRYEATFNAQTISGGLIESCTCFYLLEYEGGVNCLRVAPGTYQFEDMFDVSSSEPTFNTGERLCP